MLSVKELIANLSTLKIIIIVLSSMLFLDMVCYYIGSFIGRTTAPYPVLHDLIELIKEIHVIPTGQ